MIKEKKKVCFYPDNREILVDKGENLLRAAMEAGIYINASCGGAGTCGKCKVLIEKGEVESKPGKLSKEDYEQGYRQACQTSILSDLEVRIPPESQLDKWVLARKREHVPAGKMVFPLESEILATGWRFNPPLRKFYVELKPPSSGDNMSDLSRLLLGLKQQYNLENISVDFRVIKKLPHILREANWKVTTTIVLTRIESQLGEYQLRGSRKPKLINVEGENTVDRHYSIALDIGTTTLCGELLDVKEGRVLAESSDYNAQISYGDDVITRIIYSQRSGGLQKLQELVVSTINQIINELVEKTKVNRNYISHLVAAGNTTMTHILLGIDPKYIREAPYTPVAYFVPPVRAIHLGIKVGEHVHLYTLPMVASYIGGDIVSGILASGVYQRKAVTLYIDIGTNGEIVIGNSDWLVTASCSAGPAFEGGGIKFGMRATTGAIERVRINPSNFEPMILTIGMVKPKGICGSGLISIVAELLETGLINQNGKFNTDLPTKRLREGEDGYEYVLAWADETQIGKDIVITEADIDNLIRAKGAMYAGYQTLLESVGLRSSDLEQVIIAGAFGNYIDLEEAITIGLLPELPPDRFLFIGNGSLLGCRLISFSNEMLDDGERIAKMMTNFELSENPSFMDKYIAALFLPHTDTEEFPGVNKRLAQFGEDRAKKIGATRP